MGFIQVKNPNTRAWDAYIQYMALDGTIFAREVGEFERRFTFQQEIPLQHEVIMRLPKSELEAKIKEIISVPEDPISSLVEYTIQLISEEVKAATRHLLLLQCSPIEHRLKKYIYPIAEKFWLETIDYIDNEPYQRGEPESKFLHACFMGVTIERTYEELQKLIKDTQTNLQDIDLVTEEEYQTFAIFINKAALMGLIKRGVVIKPLLMPLAVISPSRRVMIYFAPMTNIPISELKKISNCFVSEGELPPLLKDIHFH